MPESRISSISSENIEELMLMSTDGPFDPGRILEIVPAALSRDDVRQLGQCVLEHGKFEHERRHSDAKGRLVELRVLQLIGIAANTAGDRATSESIASHLDELKTQGVAGSGSAASMLRFGIKYKRL
jgi:hypothetical protein